MITATKSLSTKQLSELYDRIYDIADRLFKKYNPCNIQVKDDKVKCINNHYNCNHLCCQYWSDCCKHWENGCTVKCLACKLFVCGYILYTYDKNGKQMRNKKYITFVNRVKWLQRIAIKYHLSNYDYYLTKKEVIRRSKTW